MAAVAVRTWYGQQTMVLRQWWIRNWCSHGCCVRKKNSRWPFAPAAFSGVVACAEWFVNGGGTAAAAMEMRTAGWWCHRTSTNAGHTNLQKNHLQQRNPKPAPSFSSIFARTSSYNEARKRNSCNNHHLFFTDHDAAAPPRPPEQPPLPSAASSQSQWVC
ncbi:hypothetical protein DEO72_LG7g2216 [Vigna unguiculata]|uniref:Uncharacterized protein n=1 Tax=Vigna unguiculata TaxID=3917 RepID=A0A4D6MMD3_VIGUN|nr:hypothetical protein DEO72_LG7g2216 [Vigna unguiculata]